MADDLILVVVVDDHQLFREGRVTLLASAEGIEVFGTAGSGDEALEVVAATTPDVVLMDMVMPVMNGAEATDAIIRKWPEAKIMIVTSFLDDDKVYPALKAGAVSYILKTSKASRIADSIRETMNGTPVLEPEVMTKMMKQMRHDRVPHEELTEREMEILLLIVTIIATLPLIRGSSASGFRMEGTASTAGSRGSST